MKRSGIITIALLAISMMVFAGNNRVTRDVMQLPEISRTFISTYFSEVEISHIKIQKNLFILKNYDVILTDGTNIEFNKSGEWVEIDGHKAAIPSAVIPTPILSYVQTHFAGREIVSIEKEWREYDITLDNGLELTFDLKGNIKDIDD